MSMLRSVLASLVLCSAACASSPEPATEGEATTTSTADMASPDSTSDPGVSSTAAATTGSAATTSAPAAPATKSFDLAEHGLEGSIELPPDMKFKKRTGKVAGVDIDRSDASKWKAGVSVLKADATVGSPAKWKGTVLPKLKGAKITKEEGDLLITFVPENQHGFVLFVKVGKDTYLCQNYGTTENDADLEPLIAACKTLKGK